MAGRPSKLELDKTIIDRIVNEIMQGVPINQATAAVGMVQSTYYLYMKRGEKEPDTIYSEFSEAVKRAHASSLSMHAKNVTRCAIGQDAKYDNKGNLLKEEIKPDGRLSIMALERRDPDNWGKTDKVRIDGEITQTCRVIVPQIANTEAEFILGIGKCELPQIEGEVVDAEISDDENERETE